MFPGNPHDHSPCSSTPAGPSTRYGTMGQRTRHGPRTKAQRGLPTIANFGAQSHGFWSRCLRLEVEVTRHRARLASGCWSQLCRTGFDPQGFYERFLNWNSSSFPELHGASFELLERNRSAQAHRGRRFFLCRGQFRADVAHGGPAKKRDTTACQRIRSWRSERRLIFDHLLRWLAERTPEVNLAGAAGGDGERPGRSESGPYRSFAV